MRALRMLLAVILYIAAALFGLGVLAATIKSSSPAGTIIGLAIFGLACGGFAWLLQPGEQKLPIRRVPDPPGGRDVLVDVREALAPNAPPVAPPAESLGELFFLSYEDANGLKSRRRITLKRSYRAADGDVYIDAWCHERQDERTFRASRMVELVDLGTGEVIDGALDFFLAREQETPEGRVARALAMAESELLALVFIARADGSMRAAERAPIVALAVERAAGVAVDPALLDKAVRRLYASPDDYRRALRALAQAPEADRLRVMAAAEAVAGAVGSVDPLERGALDLMRKRFKLPAAASPAT